MRHKALRRLKALAGAALAGVLALSGCVRTLPESVRYKLAEEQRSSVRDFQGYAWAKQPVGPQVCFKQVGDAFKGSWEKYGFSLLISGPIIIGLSPLCLLFVTQKGDIRRESRLRGVLMVRFLDDAGRPLPGLEFELNGEKARADDSGMFGVYVDRDRKSWQAPTTMKFEPRWRLASQEFRAGRRSPKKEPPPEITFEWELDGEKAVIAARAGERRLQDPARVELADAEAPADLAARVSFADDRSLIPNGALDAGEEADLAFKVRNKGKGTAFGVRLVLGHGGQGLSVPEQVEVGDIPPGSEREARAAVKAGLAVASGQVPIRIETKEVRGYDAKKLVFSLKTSALARPALEAGEASVNDAPGGRVSGNGNGVLENGETCEIVVPISNKGAGAALGVKAALSGVSPEAEVVDGLQDLGTIIAGGAAGARFLVRLPVDKSLEKLRGLVTVKEARGAQTLRHPLVLEAARLAPDLRYSQRVFDGGSSLSRGNSNGRPENGETLELEITPSNAGQLAARGVALSVRAEPDLEVRPGRVELGEIPPGEAAAPRRFALDLPRTFQGDKLRLAVELTQSDFPARKGVVELPVGRLAPRLAVSHSIGGSGDGRLSQGGQGDLVLTVENLGTLEAAEVHAAVRFGKEGVRADRAGAAMGVIAPGQAATAAFNLTVLRGARPGDAPVEVTLSQADFPALSEKFSFQVVEEAAVEVAGGPAAAVAPRAKTGSLASALSFEPAAKDDNDNGIWEEAERVSVVVRVRNAGPGRATGVEVALSGPREVVSALGARRLVGDLAPGEEREAEFSGVLAAIPRRGGDLRVAARDARFAPPPARVLAVRYERDIEDLPRYQTPKRRNAYGVVIGIEKYRGDRTPAQFAAADARSFHRYLTRALNVPEENVRLLVNDRASLADVRSVLEDWLANRVGRDSEVFFYYSGHGAPNPETGESFLVPYDGSEGNLDNTGYSLRRLYEVLAGLKAKGTLVILDSCFSGAGGPRTLLAKGTRPLVTLAQVEFGGPGAVLSAAGGSQISGTYDLKRHGLFTYHLLRALQGEADEDGDGKVTLDEVYRHVRPLVLRQAQRDNRRQEPQLQSGSGGGLWAAEALVELRRP